MILDSTKKPVPLLWTLFAAFAKIGLFTFGGGYAMISIIEDTCVERKKWITHDEMMDITVIAESTPGPMAINCATYVGFKQAGTLGSIAATLGIVAPSFIIIYLISSFLDNFLAIGIIANAFRGIKIGVGLLIFSVAIKMVKKLPPKKLPRIIASIAFLTVLLSNLFGWNISAIWLMILAGAVGYLAFSIRNRGRGGKAE